MLLHFAHRGITISPVVAYETSTAMTTAITRLTTLLSGRLVGKDRDGNRYYEQRHTPLWGTKSDGLSTLRDRTTPAESRPSGTDGSII